MGRTPKRQSSRALSMHPRTTLYRNVAEITAILLEEGNDLVPPFAGLLLGIERLGVAPALTIDIDGGSPSSA